MNPNRVDLHLHTCHSDGTFTAGEVVRRAAKAGLSAISVTDHDTISGIAEGRQAAGGRLEILSGVELTVAYRDRELHLLGYGFNEQAPELVRFLGDAQERRVGRIQAMMERLRERGIAVTLEEVQRIAGDGESVGRPHLAEALVAKRAVGSLKEAFDRYLGDHAPCFVRKATLTVPEAVRLLREHGGVAVLAHPYRIVEDEWIPDLREQGVEGLEVYHSDHTPQVAENYRRMAERLGMLVTGGSDCHGTRKAGGPHIGKVSVPYALLERLKEAIAELH